MQDSHKQINEYYDFYKKWLSKNNLGMKKLIKLLFCFLLIFVLGFPAWSNQNEAIIKIINSAKNCQANIYFSKTEINSKDRSYAYYAEIQRWFAPNIIDGLIETQNLNLIPINNCVLRGNKNYTQEANLVWLKKLQVNTIMSTDYLSNTINAGKTNLNYVFLPLTASGYQKKQESIQSLLLAFEYLAKAMPSQKLYINCFSGKYQSNLLTALYQFLLEYALKPKQTCTNLGTKQDLSFQQMLNMGNQGLLSYNLPHGFKKFYFEFGLAVCEERSEEFLQKLKNL